METPVLDLTGGELPLRVYKNLEARWRVAALYNDTGVAFAAATWTGIIFDPAAPTTPVASISVTPGTGYLDLKITKTESNKLSTSITYRYIIVQTPTDTNYGPYPVMSGEITVEAGGGV